MGALIALIFAAGFFAFGCWAMADADDEVGIIVGVGEIVIAIVIASMALSSLHFFASDAGVMVWEDQ